jgi:hypothetical protein
MKVDDVRIQVHVARAGSSENEGASIEYVGVSGHGRAVPDAG